MRRGSVKAAVTLPPMRIASLLASATETVCALGLDDRLVAISHECDYPAHVLNRPRVSRPRFDPAGLASGQIDAAVRQAMALHGSVYTLDEAALREAAPDLILTQDVCQVCAVPTSLAQQAVRALDGGSHGWDPDSPAMWGVFVASGPWFRPGFRGAPFRNVHLYELMCRLLDLAPAPNAGSRDSTEQFLRW